MKSLWSSRAWTYQESVCSSRRLLFTSEQMLFECNQSFVHESIGEKDDVRLNTFTLSPDDQNFFSAGALYTAVRRSRLGILQTRYQVAPVFYGGLSSHYTSFISHIEAYTRRHLSHQEDARNALLGICQSYAQHKVPVRHFWGIPTTLAGYMTDANWSSYRRPVSLDELTREMINSFAYGLTWQTSGSSPRRREFPTWSWAACSRQVQCNNRVIYQNANKVLDNEVRCSVVHGVGLAWEFDQTLYDAMRGGKPALWYRQAADSSNRVKSHAHQSCTGDGTKPVA